MISWAQLGLCAAIELEYQAIREQAPRFERSENNYDGMKLVIALRGPLRQGERPQIAGNP